MRCMLRRQTVSIHYALRRPTPIRIELQGTTKTRPSMSFLT
jgi:hypothetical protein